MWKDSDINKQIIQKFWNKYIQKMYDDKVSDNSLIFV